MLGYTFSVGLYLLRRRVTRSNNALKVPDENVRKMVIMGIDLLIATLLIISSYDLFVEGGVFIWDQFYAVDPRSLGFVYASTDIVKDGLTGTFIIWVLFGVKDIIKDSIKSLLSQK